MEYAIVQIGGKQYNVKKGDTIKADFDNSKSEKTVKIEKVLMIHAKKNVTIGSPFVKGASVTCDIVGEGRTRKVIAFKYKRRKSSKFKKGHRQKVISLKVKEIKEG